MFGFPAAARKVGNQSRPEKIPFCTSPPAHGRASAGCKARGNRPRGLFLWTARTVSVPIGPGEEFGAVVGSEHDDGVVVDAQIFELLHYQADVVVKLRHAGLFNRPAVLRVTQRLILVREVGDNMHARGVEPDEERLAVFFGFVHEIDGEVTDLVIHGLHALGIKHAGILNLLLADLAPARHLGRVVRIGRPGMNHVARTDDVQQILRVVRMRRVFHRVQVIQVAEEFIEAVDGGQELILVAKVVLAELTGRVALRFERGGDGAGLGGQAD